MHQHQMKTGGRFLLAGILLLAVTLNTARSEPQMPGEEAMHYEARTVSLEVAETSEQFHYRFLRPAETEAGGRYPLVFFLHGAGERGSDNQTQLKYLPTWLAKSPLRQQYPCFVVAPQCQPDQRWSPFAWSDKTSSPLTTNPTVDLAAAVAALNEVCASEAVDPQRIYLTGLSMGGYGAWELAARYPERFAAVVPICGGGDELQAAKLVTVPIWCFHGADDSVVPVERSRSMIEAIRAAGGKPRYSELPGVGHDAWTPAYQHSELLAWLFAQRRPGQ